MIHLESAGRPSKAREARFFSAASERTSERAAAKDGRQLIKLWDGEIGRLPLGRRAQDKVEKLRPMEERARSTGAIEFVAPLSLSLSLSLSLAPHSLARSCLRNGHQRRPQSWQIFASLQMRLSLERTATTGALVRQFQLGAIQFQPGASLSGASEQRAPLTLARPVSRLGSHPTRQLFGHQNSSFQSSLCSQPGRLAIISGRTRAEESERQTIGHSRGRPKIFEPTLAFWPERELASAERRATGGPNERPRLGVIDAERAMIIIAPLELRWARARAGTMAHIHHGSARLAR